MPLLDFYIEIFTVQQLDTFLQMLSFALKARFQLAPNCRKKNQTEKHTLFSFLAQNAFTLNRALNAMLSMLITPQTCHAAWTMLFLTSKEEQRNETSQNHTRRTQWTCVSLASLAIKLVLHSSNWDCCYPTRTSQQKSLDTGCFKYVLPNAMVSDGNNFGPDFDPLIHAGSCLHK